MLEATVPVSNSAPAPALPQPKADDDLKILLRSWSLDQLYHCFIKEKITIKHLSLLQPKFIDKLFENLPMGDQILFEHQLQIWKLQKLLNNDFIENDPKTNVNNLIEPIEPIIEESIEYSVPVAEEICQIDKSLESPDNINEHDNVQYDKDGDMLRATKNFNIDVSDDKEKMPDISPRVVEDQPPELTKSVVVAPSVASSINDMRAKYKDNFDKFWKLTQTMRLKDINDMRSLSEILDKWPEYRDTSKIKYISMDFFAKYPTANKFSDIFLRDMKILEKFVLMKVDKSSRDFISLQEMMKSCEDAYHFALIISLYYIFAHILLATDRSALDFAIESCPLGTFLLLNRMILTEIGALPTVVVSVGIKEIYVRFEKILYPMKSFVEAVELWLQLYLLFDIKFPPSGKNYLDFMKTYFLGIETEIKNPKIYALINELKNLAAMNDNAQ